MGKWQENKAKRKANRDLLRSQGLLKEQPRNPRGFIIKRDKDGHEYLQADTKLAHENALYASIDRQEMKASKELEKKKNKQRREQRARNKRKPGEVTTRKADK